MPYDDYAILGRRPAPSDLCEAWDDFTSEWRKRRHGAWVKKGALTK